MFNLNNTVNRGKKINLYINYYFLNIKANIYKEVMVLYWNKNEVSILNFNSFINTEIKFSNAMTLFTFKEYFISLLYFSIKSNLILLSTYDKYQEIDEKKNYTLFAIPMNTTKSNILGLKESTILIDKCDSVLGYDWIHNLIYISISKTIVVFNINRTDIQYNITTIGEQANLISFVVNPVDNKIFRSETRWKQTIIKANQDGSNPLVIYEEKSGYDINSLTIDYYTQQLLWGRYGDIISSDFFGEKIKVLISIGYPIFSFNLFERNIYYIHDKQLMRFTIDKEKSENKKSLVKLSTGDLTPIAFKIIDSIQQPINTTNRCLKSDCTHLCIPLSISQYRCVCPQNQNNCIEKVSFNSLHIMMSLCLYIYIFQ